MIIMNMNDIADELGTLSALLDVARQEIKMAAEMINPEYSPTELKRGEALQRYWMTGSLKSIGRQWTLWQRQRSSRGLRHERY